MPLPTSIISVHLPDQSYDIHVRAGLLVEAGEKIAALSTARRAFVVTDQTVGPLHAASLVQSLQTAGFLSSLIELPAGEGHKTLATVSMIYDRLLEERIERSSIVIGLGGGVIGDMTGFAAATVLRGVPFVQVPTTLLAMVDASVGGKTGVNHAAGKNLIGAFHQPIAVLIDPAVLRTLPRKSISEGLAECIKHDIIRDAAGFARLEQTIGRALDLDVDYLSELIAHNVAIKARVVEKDPTERGERAHLNLGHTFGHAIEKVSDFAVAHGAAVALGICAAMDVARKIGLVSDSDRIRVNHVFKRAELPTRGLEGMPTEALVDAMKSDKKVEAGRIKLVLPDGIGNAVIRNDVDPKIVREAIESIRS